MSTSFLIWLQISDSREACGFLETHRELLDVSNDTLLQQMITNANIEHSSSHHDVMRYEPSPRMKEIQRLHDYLYLLQDSRARGSTQTAIRAAYINLYGGFVLALPPWLEDLKNQLNTQRSPEYARERADLLSTAISCALQKQDIEQEIIAESNRLRWHALYEAFGLSNIQIMEEQRLCLETVFQIYTFTRYPYQYARMQGNRGNAYRQQGNDQHLLDEALSCYNQALRVFTYAAFPLLYAKTQHNLGATYYELKEGQQRSHLKEAIACYKNALLVYTLDDFPAYYATLQLNLASIYYEKADGEAQSNLAESITYCMCALQIFTEETFPKEYANAQYMLGNAYSELQTGDRAAHIEEALVHYRNALRIFTRDTFPTEYALAQYALGTRYRERGAGERRTNLEEAISCYKHALQIYTLDTFPVQYANAQHRLAIAYKDRIVGDRGQNIEEALLCCMNALQVYTLDMFPEDYAMQQNNLSAFYSLRQAGTRRQNLEETISALSRTLRVYTPNKFPLEYARTQFNLGLAYRERIEGERRVNLETAISYHETALRFYTREHFPRDYANIQLNLGVIYHERIEDAHIENIEEAIACYTRALHVFSADTFPLDYAKCQNNLATIYSLRIAGDRRDNVEQAILHAQHALEIYNQKDFPIEYAAVQFGLGVAYRERIEGERRTNLEEAIAYYMRALQIYTHDSFPREYALLQNNLGFLYTERIIGKRQANLEEAIAYCNRALQIYTLEAFPKDYAMVQHNLGKAYRERVQGEWQTNLEEAIVCYNRALQIYTFDAFPKDYALAHNNLGNVYWMRVVGERKDNLEEAIRHYNLALQIYTRVAFPTEWARLQHNLGAVYRERLIAEHENNVKEAIAYYQRALQVYTLDAFPNNHRHTQLHLAFTEMRQQHWEAAHDAYNGALAAQDLLMALGVGIAGRDAILTEEGLEATISDGLALIRLSRFPEAAVALEHGRAYGLTETIAMDAARPDLISNQERRSRYKQVRQNLIAAQVALNVPQEHILDPDTRRLADLELTHVYNQARTQFDATIDEIRQAQDPGNFLEATIDAETLLRLVEERGEGHALVYLGATPWGGFALAVLGRTPNPQRGPRFIALELPLLTSDLVTDLIESRVGPNGMSGIVGGFAWAQEHNGFSLLPSSSTHATFRQQANSLQSICAKNQKISMLDRAAQKILHLTEFAESIDQTFSQLSPTDQQQFTSTLTQLFLDYELKRSLDALADSALRPLTTTLKEEGVRGMTLIPCGMLAAFPLAAAEITPGQTFGDLFITSIAPSARIFQRTVHKDSARTVSSGVYTLGNPEPKTHPLDWGEAEAYTVAKLARDLKFHAKVKVQHKATRRQLIEALNKGYIVDLSCHGAFNVDAPLQSTLRLARGETVTLGQILSHEVDLQGLRLLILSACQTAILDLRGASDEVHSLAVGMLQAGADAVLASLWPVDDKATYLLMARFAQEWFPTMHSEPPAAALARAQYWLRTVTNDALKQWEAPIRLSQLAKENDRQERSEVTEAQELASRGNYRYDMGEAIWYIHHEASKNAPTFRPYEDPVFWAGFQITGW